MYILLLEYGLIGALAGILAGLLGVGGGLIIIPGLLFVFSSQSLIPHDLLMYFVVGTSFASILITTLVSLRSQLRTQHDSWPLFFQLFPGVLVGTVLGTILATLLDTHILKTLFGLFMIFVSLQMFFRIRESGLSEMPGPINRWIAALFIGVSSGLLGISGGAMTIPYLTYFHVPVRQAMAASTACGVVIAVTGMISFMIAGHNISPAPDWSTGYIYWPAALIISLISPPFVQLGAFWSSRLPVVRLRQILAIFIAAVGLEMLLK